MREYFPKLRPSRENVKVELNLSNYATKQNGTGVDTSKDWFSWLKIRNLKN